MMLPIPVDQASYLPYGKIIKSKYPFIMPRLARANGVGLPYHLTQRGNHRQEVFFTPEDSMLYLRWLGEYREKYQ